MDVKEAVKLAKQYVSDLFADESLSNLGLEEIERNDDTMEWFVTLGFSRPWNTQRNALTALTGDVAAGRTYRVVRIADYGEVLSIRKRDSSDR